ncbi:serine hydrolase domain-containing protein [Colwellia hornerae]|uniref:Beta-lactamase family protein n=1 Tax=Colwellia hornerae TaxID=89402 RepID=A0A5C6QK52_9GAMM|nr:serine hydrolase domain-containing protein [Colwellia hornerae]TWX58552.1 beta-lactamase family protein [Colwellia hornerae]TWX59618.1 beta-lactamase family protein [Colwellia hornerae]TWX69344.1 beta-lactamase family protein [Colwellia hornerae]
MKHSKKLIMRVIAAIVTVSSIYIFAPWQAAIYYFAPLPLTVEQQVNDTVNHGLDGIIVYVQKGEQKANFYASGWHNRDKKIPADPKALFKIGSIGKLYNAAAVAKLVAKGSLSLDNTLADYLPSLLGRIEYADQITLLMMLQHRSGIPNYTDHNDFSWSERSIGGDNNLNLVLDSSADFKPDSDYSYSNTNYLLLGKIMTKVLGYDNRQFISNEILAPLSLKRTFFSIKDIDLQDLMSGYYVGYNNDFKELNQGYIATAEDVGIFLRALNDGRLFTDAEQEIYASIYKYEHTGWVLGYYSIARYHKNIDTVVIQFVNTVGDNTLTLTDVVYDRIIQILNKLDETK